MLTNRAPAACDAIDMAGIGAIAQTPSQLLNGTDDEGDPTMSSLILDNGGA